MVDPEHAARCATCRREVEALVKERDRLKKKVASLERTVAAYRADDGDRRARDRASKPMGAGEPKAPTPLTTGGSTP